MVSYEEKEDKGQNDDSGQRESDARSAAHHLSLSTTIILSSFMYLPIHREIHQLR
jgi:hypothetical protein